MVALYAAKFTNIAECTNLKNHGKRAYFVCGLNTNSEFFYCIVYTLAGNKKPTLLLKTVRMAREMDGIGSNFALLLGTPGASAAAAAVNLYTMDVDVELIMATQMAGRTHVDFLRAMRGSVI